MERVTDTEIIKPFYRQKTFVIALCGIGFALCFFLGAIVWNAQNMERERTQMEGQLRLSGITTRVDSKLSQAEILAESIGSQVEQLLIDDRFHETQLTDFVARQTKELMQRTDGVASGVYVAYEDKLYMDNFVPLDTFVLTDRDWYIGAKKQRGELYVTPPYVDANTHKMCYSISLLLEDGATVVGIDYTMADIQQCIEEMSAQDAGISLIVDQNGMIMGHSNHNFVAAHYSQLQYKDIIKKVFSLYGTAFECSIKNKTYTVYSDKTANDWYLITLVEKSSRIFGVTNKLFFVLVCTLVLSVGILAWFIISYRKRVLVEQALYRQQERLNALEQDLRKPLNTIFSHSKLRNLGKWAAENSLEVIQESADQMDSVIHAYLHDTKEQNTTQTGTDHKLRKTTDKGYIRQTYLIIGVLLLTSVFAVVINTYTQISRSNARLMNEEQKYCAQTKEWVSENSCTLNTLAQTFTANPELIKDYAKAVQYLDDMVSNMESISVAYIVNPLWEHTVIMNNGWEPKAGWKVEEREWYVGTMESENENGFHISSPYYDEQTGNYCVTISRIVYDMKGDVIGILGIDYYMDKLVAILGQSYTDDGYAFLTDSDYTIMNHPNQEYQMAFNQGVSAGSLVYREALTKEGITQIKDYDGNWKVCVVQEEELSGFSVILVKDWWTIYGEALYWDLIFLCVFGLCIFVVWRIMKNLNSLQEQITSNLLIAADNAKAASKAKSDFLAQMSHEIRTPINAVLGMNEMILRETTDKGIVEYADNIQSAGRTLLSLINSILDFSKIEDGKMEIVPVAYDTASCVNDMVQMIAARATDKGLSFHVDIDEELPKVLYGDDVRIRQIITNLLTNAVKYTKEGSVTLRIHGKKQEESDKYYLDVSVEDTGIGIRKEDIDKLAISFKRLDQVKNRNIEGTGLGISIVQRLLEMMGSKLEVSSVYGEGSVFSFILEQKVVDGTAIGNYEELLKKNSKRHAEGMHLYAPKAKVLVVDDNSINLKVAAGLMKQYGFCPKLVQSGKECMETVQREQFHIIFMDHMMPEMDGVETLHNMRDNHLITDNTIVIMMTANAISGAREGYLKEGFTDYLTKPIEVDKLENALSKYLPEELVSYVSEEDGKAVREDREWEEHMGENNEQRKGLAALHSILPELQTEVALPYCMGSEEFLWELLQEYASNDRERDIASYYENKDWENYRIQVHALKSTSLTLGLSKLSEEAKVLEFAVKEGRIEDVLAEHEATMEHYRRVLAAIKACS